VGYKTLLFAVPLGFFVILAVALRFCTFARLFFRLNLEGTLGLARLTMMKVNNVVFFSKVGFSYVNVLVLRGEYFARLQKWNFQDVRSPVWLCPRAATSNETAPRTRHFNCVPC